MADCCALRMREDIASARQHSDHWEYSQDREQ
jgi:hypothetical protein